MQGILKLQVVEGSRDKAELNGGLLSSLSLVCKKQSTISLFSCLEN